MMDLEMRMLKYAERFDAVGKTPHGDTIRKWVSEINAFSTLALALADACDDVGVNHFDSDDLAVDVVVMQTSTLRLRGILAKGMITGHRFENGSFGGGDQGECAVCGKDARLHRPEG